MAVVINELEVTPPQNAAQPAPAPSTQGTAAPSPDNVREISKALHREAERERRLWAH